jgi:hypothetical protein
MKVQAKKCKTVRIIEERVPVLGLSGGSVRCLRAVDAVTGEPLTRAFVATRAAMEKWMASAYPDATVVRAEGSE